MTDKTYDDGYDRGYDDGYDEGSAHAFKDGYDEGYDEALADHGMKKAGTVDNMCLKCDCKDYGFDCVLENPRAYMTNKQQGKMVESKPKRKRIKNPDYDRAMEIFSP